MEDKNQSNSRITQQTLFTYLVYFMERETPVLHLNTFDTYCTRGWSGGAMVLGKLPEPGRPTIWIIVGQGPTALAVGTGGGCLDIFFSHLSFLFSYSLSLGDGPI